MACAEHLQRLLNGVAEWNTWRQGGTEESKTPNLEGADLSGKSLENADLSRVKLSKANLTNANLKNANLTQATLTEAVLDDACLEGANLERAQAGTARLRRAKLQRANLRETFLSGSDLRDARDVKLDSTFDRNVTFSPWAADPWSKLRRGYTGPRFALTLFLVTIALAPYGAKALMWVA